MGDMKEIFEAMTEEKKRRHASNFERNHAEVEKMGVPFEVYNDRQHIVFRTKNGKIDFWPSSGKWHCPTNKKKGFGLTQVKALIKLMS